MRKESYRAIAICVFHHDGRILAAEGYDDVKRQKFYRPLGGAVEFGEFSRATVERELEEELGAAVTDLQLLGVLENIFIFNGKAGHEIVFVYDGCFVDRTLYDLPELIGHEHADGSEIRAVWLALSEQTESSPPIYPTGLLELLQRK